jgi:hypothetical protein
MNFASVLSMLVFDAIFYMILTIFVQSNDKNRRRLKDPYHLCSDILVDSRKRYPEFRHCLQDKCKCKKKGVEDQLRELGSDKYMETPLGDLRTKVLGNLGLLHAGQLQKSDATDTSSKVIEEQNLTRDCGVKIRNITKSYQAENVLKSVSCDFYTGEIACICG